MSAPSPAEGGAAETVQALLDGLRDRLALASGRDDAIGTEARAVAEGLAAIAPAPAAWEPTAHPLRRFLPTALDLLAATAPGLAAALGRVGPGLPWRYGYAPRADAPGLDGAMGWAELVGPAAPWHSKRVCFGLTLIGPHSHYLPHHHPAVELYHVLAGTAAWTAAGITRVQPPGAFILHPAGQVHAMRTDAEPLLALYSWSGDVVSPSVWAEPAVAEEPR